MLPEAPRTSTPARRSLIGQTPDRIAELITGLPGGGQRFRGHQIYRWLHARAADRFSAMTDVPVSLRGALDETFAPTELTLGLSARSRRDDTLKLVLVTRDGAEIEAVRLGTPKRVTLCISSQVGCGFGCRFCRTAQMGFWRNLRPEEIVDQVLHIDRVAPLPRRYNLVFMGMGEPLANYDHVTAATAIFGHPEGLAISPRRITLSTVGLAPEIRRLAVEHPRLRLAVSLTATDDALRASLIPIGKRYGLRELIAAVRFHVEKTGRRVTFEYVMLEGVNDSLSDAKRLVRIANQVPCKLNLIPYNGTGTDGFASPPPAAVQRFIEYLYPRTYAATVRATQGRDILAACGQLARRPAGHAQRRGAAPPQAVARQRPVRGGARTTAHEGPGSRR